MCGLPRVHTDKTKASQFRPLENIYTICNIQVELAGALGRYTQKPPGVSGKGWPSQHTACFWYQASRSACLLLGWACGLFHENDYLNTSWRKQAWTPTQQHKSWLVKRPRFTEWSHTKICNSIASATVGSHYLCEGNCSASGAPVC